MPMLDHFSVIARWYDRLGSAPDKRNWRSLLRLPCEGLLLDAGGGTGRLSHPLRGLTGGVVLVDEAIGMLQEAQKKPGLGLVRSELERLPYPAHSFDRAMMIDALHHVADHARVAAELVRILNPGGRLVIIEPDIETRAIKVVALLEKLLLMRSHLLNAREMTALFKSQDVRVTVTKEDYSVILIVEKN